MYGNHSTINSARDRVRPSLKLECTVKMPDSTRLFDDSRFQLAKLDIYPKTKSTLP